MTISRRTALSALAATAGIGLAAPSRAAPARTAPAAAAGDETAALQAVIDASAPLGRPVSLPSGTIRTGPLTLRPGTILTGAGPATRLVFSGGGAALTARDAAGIRLSGLVIDGAWKPLGAEGALVSLAGCADIAIDGVTVRNAAGHGLAVASCTGRVERCSIEQAADAGLFALDSRLVIAGNAVEACGNNGILLWRSAVAEDGSEIRANRISRIRADGGGSGQNGNGINVFRAGGVIVAGNSIADCALSAVRANRASNIAITSNQCARLGEVALYAEFGFEGALIASNLVDRAAAGISVTNFDEGGRLAVVQGNLIRNLFRRDHEPVDTRGHGITVEADTAVSGNTIEGAPAAGIVVGWGRFMRDVTVTGNLVRASRSGILVSADQAAGHVLIASNMISGATDGAIRAHDRGRPVGPDLVGQPTAGRVTIQGNAAA